MGRSKWQREPLTQSPGRGLNRCGALVWWRQI